MQAMCREKKVDVFSQKMLTLIIHLFSVNVEMKLHRMISVVYTLRCVLRQK